jgi:hypothetical protein
LVVGQMLLFCGLNANQVQAKMGKASKIHAPGPSKISLSNLTLSARSYSGHVF